MLFENLFKIASALCDLPYEPVAKINCFGQDKSDQTIRRILQINPEKVKA